MKDYVYRFQILLQPYKPSFLWIIYSIFWVSCLIIEQPTPFHCSSHRCSLNSLYIIYPHLGLMLYEDCYSSCFLMFLDSYDSTSQSWKYLSHECSIICKLLSLLLPPCFLGFLQQTHKPYSTSVFFDFLLIYKLTAPISISEKSTIFGKYRHEGKNRHYYLRLQV